MSKQIDNSEDILDSRAIIERIEELQDLRSEVEEDEDGNLTGASFCDSYPVEAEELAALEALAKEASPYADDWEYGVTLIRDSYFEEYARELVEDCGYIPKDLPSWIEIDWEATARNVRMDYTSVEFQGVTYWVR